LRVGGRAEGDERGGGAEEVGEFGLHDWMEGMDFKRAWMRW
jgi:hypothetical protein